MAIVIKGSNPEHTTAGKFIASEYDKHLAFKQAVGSVNITKKTSTGEQLQSTTQVPVNKGVLDGVCKVGCSGARTINLGNYESVKISVWLEMSCPKDSIAETYDYITDWVGERLTEAVKQTKE